MQRDDAGVLVLKVREPTRRNHQFLMPWRANRDTKVEAPLLAFAGAQR